MPRTKSDFFTAAQNGHLDVIKECLEEGIDINIRGDYGRSALYYAITGNRLETVQFLIKSGINTDLCDTYYNYSPLTLAKDKSASIIAYLESIERKQTTPEWSLFGDDALAHTVVSVDIQRQLTEIFNFSSRERIIISENLKTKEETVSPSVSFPDIESPAIEKAFEKFRELGGKANEEYVLRGTARLNKPAARL